MPAYVIVDVTVHDSEDYTAYRLQSGATVAAYGGRYLARGGVVEVLEGDSQPGRVVVLEFPSAAQARDWWDSPEYSAIKPIRQRSSTTNLLIVEGYVPDPA